MLLRWTYDICFAIDAYKYEKHTSFHVTFQIEPFGNRKTKTIAMQREEENDRDENGIGEKQCKLRMA